MRIMDTRFVRAMVCSLGDEEIIPATDTFLDHQRLTAFAGRILLITEADFPPMLATHDPVHLPETFTLTTDH